MKKLLSVWKITFGRCFLWSWNWLPTFVRYPDIFAFAATIWSTIFQRVGWRTWSYLNRLLFVAAFMSLYIILDINIIHIFSEVATLMHSADWTPNLYARLKYILELKVNGTKTSLDKTIVLTLLSYSYLISSGLNFHAISVKSKCCVLSCWTLKLDFGIA